MKAVILAGGKGTRLHPLTARTPKPLVRVLDQPVMAHILALLAHYGVDEAAVTVSYLAHEIRNRFGEEFGGIRLRYSHEETPLGTAGGVREAVQLLEADSDESILVISGDSLCDFDLERAAQFHRQNDAEATLLLKHSDHPLAYGVVKCAEDGRILGFVEKPEWSQVCSDRVNTGIYFLKKSLLERIPHGIQYDFSADLFPRMLSEQARLFGCLCDGYWRDIGSLHSYYACNKDALNDQIKLYLPSDGMIRSARDGKWYCSYGADVHEDARICAWSVIGRGCSVEADALVSASILCDDCVVEKGAVVKDSVLDRNVRVKKNALVAARSVVGYGSQLEEGSDCVFLNLPPQTRLCSRSFLEDDSEGVVWEEDRFLFRHSKDADVFRRFGAALGRCFSGPFFLSKETESVPLRWLCEGLESQDAPLYLSDAPGVGVSAYLAAALCGYGVHVSSGENGVSLRLFLPDGLSVGRGQRKTLIAAFRSCPSLGETESGKEEPPRLSARRFYLMSLLSSLPASIAGLELQTEESSLFSEALRMRGWKNQEGEPVAMRLTHGGEGCIVEFSHKESYDFSRLQEFFLQEESQKKKPQERVLFSREEQLRSEGKSLLDQRELVDPCFALCRLLGWLRGHSTEKLRDGLRRTSPAGLRHRFYPHDGKYGSFTKNLERLFASVGTEPLVFHRPQGILRIVPSALTGYRIYAETRKAEAAEELFAFAEETLKPKSESTIAPPS